MRILQFLNQWKFTHNNVRLYLVYIFIPNTINHITRAGMLIDSRKNTMLFSFISDMMDWPSQNKTLQNKRGPPLKILSNSKSIIKTVNMQLLLLRDLTSVGKSYLHWWSIPIITEGVRKYRNNRVVFHPIHFL